MLSPYRSFWISEDFKKIYDRFKEILKREGKSVGAHLRKYIAEYVDIHDPGNPQARITSYAEVGPVDTAIIEGRIREFFRNRGPDVSYALIRQRCKQDVSDLNAALAMTERVATWLREQGIKVWR